MISVVIPVYNRELELTRALKSVLTQTIQDFEILVIDDFSEIDLKKVCAGFNDVRIKYHRLEQKGNANVCRNLGIKLAKGDYIAMLDSDDEWLNTHLELKQKRIRELNADGVFGSVIIDNSITRITGISRPFGKNERMINYLLSGGLAFTPTHFYKSECAKNILWDETLLRHQDYDYSVRFAAKYDFKPTEDPTCIVYWEAGKARDQSVESQLKFMDIYKSDITPSIYNQYFRNLYMQISLQENISHKLIQVAKKKSSYYIKFCSLNDYLTVNGINKGALYKIWLRLEFIVKILIA